MANKYWIGSTSSSGSSWNVAGNWSGSGVPATGDTIYMNSSYTIKPTMSIDTNPSIAALYATGYTGSIVIGTGAGSISLTIGSNPGDFILDPGLTFTEWPTTPGAHSINYQPATNSGSVNLNGVTLPTTFRPATGFRLTGSMNILYDFVIAGANTAVSLIYGTTGSAIYCNRNINNPGGTAYTFLVNTDFYMIGTGSHTIGSGGAANNNLFCKNFYISSSNGSGSFTVYGLNLATGYSQAATFTGSFEYTTGRGLRLASSGVPGQLGISNAVAGQMINVQVNNKTNPSDRIQFDPGSSIVFALNAVTPQTFPIMSDIIVSNNGIIQLGFSGTSTFTFNSISGSRFVIKEGTISTAAGGGTNYNGTVTCSFEGPSTFTTNINNSTWRLPIIIDTGLSTLNVNSIAPMNNYTEYRSGKMYCAPDRYFYLNAATFINAHKAALSGGNHFMLQAATTNTMNEFPSGTPSRPALIRSSTAGTNFTVNLVNGYDPAYMPPSSYKTAKNVILSNVNVTGKPLYILGKPVPQLLKVSYSSAQPYLLASRGVSTGMRYINESFFGFPKGNASNATTNIGGALTRNIGAMTYGWGNSAQATDPKTVT